VINSNLGLISHRLATIHPLQRDGQTTDKQHDYTIAVARQN